MTLSSSPSSQVAYGDGVTTSFPYSFAINTSDGSDIYPFVVDDDGVVTQLTSNYSINTGTARVTYPSVGGISPLGPSDLALPTGWTLVLLRIEPLSQTLSLTTQGTFDAPSIMSALDKIMMVIQQLQEQINRCVKYPVGTVPASVDVAAFLAVVSAQIQSPPPSGTYAYLKSLALVTPGTPFMGLATDLGAVGQSTPVWYCGIASVGDQGFFMMA